LSSRRATSGSGERKRRKPWGVCTLALPRRPARKILGFGPFPASGWCGNGLLWIAVGVCSPADHRGPERNFASCGPNFGPWSTQDRGRHHRAPYFSAGCRHSAFRGPRRRVDELAGGSGPLLGCPCRRSGQCPACDRWFQPTHSTHRTTRLPDLIANTDLAAIAYECGLR
jgi:hypothetical protein